MQPATRNAKYTKIRYFLCMETNFDGMTCCHETPEGKTPVTIMPLVNPDCYGFAPPVDFICTDLGLCWLPVQEKAYP